jgi:hypothetical protein
MEIQKNSEALIVAGSETTATCLSATAHLLGKNPQIMQTVLEEVRPMFTSEDQITIKTTTDLTYMQACIEESLRMFPPAVLSPTRISPGDFVGGYYIPKNVSKALCNALALMTQLTNTENRPKFISTNTPATTAHEIGIVLTITAPSDSCRKTTHFMTRRLPKTTRSLSTHFLLVQPTASGKISPTQSCVSSWRDCCGGSICYLNPEVKRGWMA